MLTEGRGRLASGGRRPSTRGAASGNGGGPAGPDPARARSTRGADARQRTAGGSRDRRASVDRARGSHRQRGRNWQRGRRRRARRRAAAGPDPSSGDRPPVAEQGDARLDVLRRRRGRAVRAGVGGRHVVRRVERHVLDAEPQGVRRPAQARPGLPAARPAPARRPRARGGRRRPIVLRRGLRRPRIGDGRGRRAAARGLRRSLGLPRRVRRTPGSGRRRRRRLGVGPLVAGPRR